MDSYIFADLIQRTAVYLKNELAARGKYTEWPDKVKEICRKEKRAGQSQKGYADYLWHRMRRMQLTTREMFFLVSCWALTVAKETPIHYNTERFQDLIDELVASVEAGVMGKVSDISKEECEKEWDRVVSLVPELNNIYEGLVAEKNHA